MKDYCKDHSQMGKIIDIVITNMGSAKISC